MQISLRATPIQLQGTQPECGTTVPDWILVNQKLQDVTLSSVSTPYKIIYTVPSLDTPVCSQSSQQFYQLAAEYKDLTVLIVSADLPFAQSRFCKTASIKNLQTLSSFRSTFADDYGLTMLDGPLAGLLARAVLVVDQHQQLIYREIVADLTDEPDYQAALQNISKHDKSG